MSLSSHSECATTTTAALTVWKPPLFSIGPTPPPSKRFSASARRLQRILQHTDVAANGSWTFSSNMLLEVARQLDEQMFTYVDHFIGGRASDANSVIFDEVSFRLEGVSSTGMVSSGAAVSALRSDISRWARAGRGASASPLDTLVDRVDALVAALREQPRQPAGSGSPRDDVSAAAASAALRTRLELQNTTHRSDAMLAVYPAGGSKYVRHHDNVCTAAVGKRCNGRRLTAVYYLGNAAPTAAVKEEVAEDEAPLGQPRGNGLHDATAGSPAGAADAVPPFEPGALRLYAAGPPDSDALIDIQPLPDRLALFWSDERVPHAVLPTARMHRYAVTLWYFDEPELQRANERLSDAGGARQEVHRF